MRKYRKRIGIIIYANPDFYPPVINAIHILAKEFDLIVVCRNQEKPQLDYPKDTKLYRLGRLKTAREKEMQSLVIKILEYVIFSIRVIFYILFYRPQLIYSYDMHGFICGLLASRINKRIPLIYHNHDMDELKEIRGLSYLIKHLELDLARYADRIVFPDTNRARLFKNQARLNYLPQIVMNAPLTIKELPSNELKEILRNRQIPEDFKVVFYQGQINDTYCILEIIKSMILWPKNFVFVFLGWASSDFMEKINNLVDSLNLKDRVIYLPSLPYPQHLIYTRGAYLGLGLNKPVNINHRFYAGASNKIFEYLSLGIPVIINEAPWVREVFDSSVAYFANPYSPESIAEVVNQASLNEEEYHKKSQAARLIHLTKFNYEAQFKPILEYIKTSVDKCVYY